MSFGSVVIFLLFLILVICILFFLSSVLPNGSLAAVVLIFSKNRLFFLMFILFLRERERTRVHAHVGEGQREGDRGFEAGSVLIAESLTLGSNSRTLRS